MPALVQSSLMEGSRYYDPEAYQKIYEAPLLVDKIRILSLLPPIDKQAFNNWRNSELSEPIRCKPETVPLDEEKYFSVTYAWGDRSNLKAVEVNGATLWATSNVYNYPVIGIEQLLRPIEGSPYTFENCKIWIESVCIDQHNYQEKQHRIQLMKAIFASGECTDMYLPAPADGDETRCEKTIQWLDRLNDCMSKEDFWEDKARRQTVWDEDAYQALLEMFSQPWFERRWVIQEVALTPNPVLGYGPSQVMLWETFIETLSRIVVLWIDRYESVDDRPVDAEFLHPSIAPSRLGETLRASGFDIPEIGDHDEWNVESDAESPLIEPMQPTVDFYQLKPFALVVTSSGRLALVPPWTQIGDRICVLYGCSSPLLLCESSTENCLEIRGEVYIGGFMFGEAVQAEKEGRLSKKVFHLV